MASSEYKEPDAHYPDGSSMMECNRCHGMVWTGDDGWACDCDSAMFPYAVDLAIAAAEERGRAEGRQWAIDTLRDTAAYLRWAGMADLDGVQRTFVVSHIASHARQFHAQYLEAVAPGADT